MWAELIPAMVQLGTSIAGATQGSRNPYNETAMQNQADALQAAKTYSEAAMNPSSPHFRALQALQEAELKRQIQAGIQQLIQSQNRARARGVIGALVNPERRDESISQAISKQFAATGEQANTKAQGLLQQAAQSAMGQAGGYGSMNNLLSQYGTQNANAFSNILQNISRSAQSPQFTDALSKLFGSGQSQVAFPYPQQQQPYAMPAPAATADELTYKTNFGGPY